MGGGIFVYNALVAAAKMQTKAQAGTRHIILFADAADAEQPGDYKALLEKTTKAGITVSVVGLGTPFDSDAEFLRDVAKRGKGRCFFTANPHELPRLFAQDTFVIARNTFVDEPVNAAFTGKIRVLSPLKFGKTLPLSGYNLCYLRPKASAAAITIDEYKAPIIAFWQQGLGKVLCYTGEVDGKYSGKFTAWSHSGDLLAAVTSWTAGLNNHGLPDNILLTQNIDNGINHIQLHLDPERSRDPFKKIPEIITLIGQPGRKPNSKTNKMSWETPDILGCSLPLDSDNVYLSTLKTDSFAPYTLPPVSLPYPPEFKPVDSTNQQSDIFRLCRNSGGRERINLSNIWDDLPRRIRYYPLAAWLLLVAMLLLLLEVLERRSEGMFNWRRSASTKTSTKAPTGSKTDAKPSTRRKKRVSAKTKPATAQRQSKSNKPVESTEPVNKSPLSEALKQAKRNKD
jgi:hypothetical protein